MGIAFPHWNSICTLGAFFRAKCCCFFTFKLGIHRFASNIESLVITILVRIFKQLSQFSEIHGNIFERGNVHICKQNNLFKLFAIAEIRRIFKQNSFHLNQHQINADDLVNMSSFSQLDNKTK